jgi:hypothetical protein
MERDNHRDRRGNPKPRSRTFEAAGIIAERLTGAAPDLTFDLADFGPALLDWSEPRHVPDHGLFLTEADYSSPEALDGWLPLGRSQVAATTGQLR